jgi:FlaA1/EpsC-like NDP-sugar epimerase/lipopolysaccharide/colanic/teichoic acid biosynthesis glycosyltransferase
MFHLGARVGRDGRLFRICKLRTMVVGAEHKGLAVTSAGDARITRFGAVLRRTKLDELPQLLNVLKGDMSLVGPRPEHLFYVARYTPEQRRILTVRPGMTSLASLVFRHEEQSLGLSNAEVLYSQAIVPAKLAIELAYVERQSFLYDLQILARTIRLLVPPPAAARRVTGLVRKHVPWGFIDGVLVAAGFYVALMLRFVDAPADAAPVLAHLNAAILPVAALYVAANYAWKLHRHAWRYAGPSELLPLAAAAGTSTFIATTLDLLVNLRGERFLPLSVVLVGGFLAFVGFVLVRYRRRLVSGWRLRNGATVATSRKPTRALIYGAGEAGQLLAWRLLTGKSRGAYEIIGFVDDDRAKQGLRIHGITVVGNRFDLARLVTRENVDLIILAMTRVGGERLRAILAAAQETPAQIKIVPSVFDSVERSTGSPLLREVQVQDLLGRAPVAMDVPECRGLLDDRVVLVTGACGSIGQELCRQLASLAPRSLVVLDNNESGLSELEVELRARLPGTNLQAIVADVTDERRLDALFREIRPQIIFHAAGYTHVPLMERYPEEAVRVNIGGTRTVLTVARRYGGERFVLVSTDKAVQPTSVMGATKRLAEMLVIGAARSSDDSQRSMRCTAVRFGNVLGSRGSVVPTFARQIEMGGPVTVTHPEITRYFIDISEAARLIIQAAVLTKGGDIFILEMGNRIRIDDLARRMIRLRGLRPDVDIAIIYTGIRPGEKLHEELAYVEEEKQPTPHPSISVLSAGNGQTVPATVPHERSIQTLLALAARGSRERLVHELLRLSQAGPAIPPADRADRPKHPQSPIEGGSPLDRGYRLNPAHVNEVYVNGTE